MLDVKSANHQNLVVSALVLIARKLVAIGH